MRATVKDKPAMIVAVDQGNAYMKTQDTISPSCVFEKLEDDVMDDDRRKIVIDGETFIETSRTLPQMDNKANSRMKINTYVAVGDQLLKSGKTTRVIEESIVLLLGVPNDSSFKKQDAINLQKYYGNPKLWEFDYRNHHFKLTVVEVCIYRQGKAIMTLVPVNQGRVTIIDVGGQTTDVIHYDAGTQTIIYSGMIDRSGMKGFIRSVSSKISTLEDKIRPEDYENYLVSREGLSKEQASKSKRYATDWTEDLIQSISESIMDGLQVKRFGKIFLAGGGSAVLEPYIRDVLKSFGIQDGDVKLIPDAQTANARAYVKLKRRSMATATKK